MKKLKATLSYIAALLIAVIILLTLGVFVIFDKITYRHKDIDTGY